MKTRVDEMTVSRTRNAIAHAFRDLRRQGYFARANFQCCGSCAVAAIPEAKGKRFAYYHAQDAQDLRKSGRCFIGWAGDGQLIATTLRRAGLMVDWDGEPTSRMFVALA